MYKKVLKGPNETFSWNKPKFDEYTRKTERYIIIFHIAAHILNIN